MNTLASSPGEDAVAQQETGEQPPESQRHPVTRAAASSLVSAFNAQAVRRASEPALRYRRNGKWSELSWLEWHDRARAVAAALIALGVEPGDRVAIVSRTRAEWAIADLGVMMAGAATTAISPWSPPERAAFLLNDSGAKVVICEDAKQLEKLAAHWVELPALMHAVCFEESNGFTPRPLRFGSAHERALVPARGSVSGWTGLLTLGRAEMPGLERVLGYLASALKAEHVATLAYTSGTTGMPKGVLLTHGNVLYSSERIAVGLALTPEDELLLSLPLTQVFARFVLHSAFHSGFVAVVDHDLSALWQQCRELRPTAAVTVPRLYEGLYQQLHGLPPEAVRETLGGRLRLLGSGGAPLAAELASFVASTGVPLIEGYGLTESSTLLTLTAAGEADGHHVGRPPPGTEIAIAPDGEILACGPGIMQGYYRRAEDNRRALVAVDGKRWLHTGDLGRLDRQGRLTLLGRKPKP
jgi:long-chain acyl-CoA synthetase